MDIQSMIYKIKNGALDAAFARLYGKDAIEAQRKRYISAIEEFADLFGAAAEKGIALEINVGSLMGGLRQKGLTLETAEESQLIRMLRLGKQAGCKFFFGSDSHATGHMEGLANAPAFAQLLALTEDDIMPLARG